MFFFVPLFVSKKTFFSGKPHRTPNLFCIYWQNNKINQSSSFFWCRNNLQFVCYLLVSFLSTKHQSKPTFFWHYVWYMYDIQVKTCTPGFGLWLWSTLLVVVCVESQKPIRKVHKQHFFHAIFLSKECFFSLSSFETIWQWDGIFCCCRSIQRRDNSSGWRCSQNSLRIDARQTGRLRLLGSMVQRHLWNSNL